MKGMRPSGRATIKAGPASGRSTLRSAGPSKVVNPQTRAYPAIGVGGAIQTTLRHPEAAQVETGNAPPFPANPTGPKVR